MFSITTELLKLKIQTHSEIINFCYCPMIEEIL